MPRALPPEIRLDIVRRHLNGQALPQQRDRTATLPPDTVRALLAPLPRLWRAGAGPAL